MGWIVRIAALLVVLLVVLVGGLFLLPADRVAQIAADQIRNATGRDVTISGDVSMTFWPTLGASVGALEVGNAEWSEQGPMLMAQNAALGIDAMALLGGEIRITNIEATSPTIRLESRKDGRASWRFTDASGAAQITTETSPDSAPQAVSIERLRITDATLIYDAEGADLVSYSGVDLALDWPDPAASARIDMVMRPADAPVQLTADVVRFAGFLGGEIQPVDVTLKTDVGQVGLSGRAGISGDVAGALTASTGDTDGFLKVLGLAGADLPPGLGRSIEMTSQLTLTQDRQLSLRDLIVDLGGNSVRGEVDIGLDGVPQITANLATGKLDLRSTTRGSADEAAESAPTSEGWSRAPLDASGLAAFNGDIALVADSVDLGSLQLGSTRAVLRNDRSRMVFELREVQAYQGRLSGEFVMNNRNGLSVGGKLTATGIEAQALLDDLADVDRLSGRADGQVQFLGVGESVHAIMTSLSGQGSVRFGQGRISGIDLDRLMRSGQVGGGTTVFDSLVANFVMSQGNLQNDDLLLSLQRFEARGEGRIGLGAQDMDYLFTPRALRGDGEGIAIPVRIQGPWSGPRILPDLGAAVDLNFAEEKKKAEEKVKQEVQRAVQDRLGVTAEEGQSVEEAIEKKIEDEIGKKLKSLFD